LRNVKNVAEELAQNVVNCVRWYDSISLMAELGTSIFIEINPGNVLSRLCNDLVPQLKSISLEDCSFAYLRSYIEKEKQ
jgi:malonate decarboxylase epsilon subunit